MWWRTPNEVFCCVTLHPWAHTVWISERSDTSLTYVVPGHQRKEMSVRGLLDFQGGLLFLFGLDKRQIDFLASICKWRPILMFLQVDRCWLSYTWWVYDMLVLNDLEVLSPDTHFNLKCNKLLSCNMEYTATEVNILIWYANCFHIAHLWNLMAVNVLFHLDSFANNFFEHMTFAFECMTSSFLFWPVSESNQCIHTSTVTVYCWCAKIIQSYWIWPTWTCENVFAIQLGIWCLT